jgi:hypothetical protein
MRENYAQIEITLSIVDCHGRGSGFLFQPMRRFVEQQKLELRHHPSVHNI